MVVKIKDLDMDEIESLLYDTKNFLELKKELENLGYSFEPGKKGLKEAYNIAMRYWNEYREQKLPLDSIPIEKPKYLPGVYLKNSCNTLKIIGVFHGFDGSNFNDFYRSKILEITKKEKDFRIYYESGFEKHYIPQIRHHRIHSFYDEELVTMKDAFKILFYYNIVLNFYRLMYKLGLSMVLDDFSRKIIWLNEKVSSDAEPEKYIMLSREIGKRIKLPPQHSISYFSIVDGTMKRVIARRSIHMADVLLEDFLYSDCINVYALVGQGHEGEIEYIIKKKLGEYKSARDLEYLKLEKQLT